MIQHLVYCLKNRDQCLTVAIIDGSTNLIHACAILQIQDKQQLDILVLLAYHLLHIGMHSHTTIVTNEHLLTPLWGHECKWQQSK